ncbi:alpha/beta fold hydrolase [Sphingomonas sp. ID0503]|uniref:alpha/beta fold hydrolase n=1 Tax=Sphingomonas sp. ID0503 TaxID=3399691 RepID=UPI003AFB50DF
MAAYTDGYWWSRDNLRLHYRDYPGRADRPTILCIPGLTRNARDFAALAERLSPEWRVICVELRGRGESAYAPDAMTYVPPIYLQDLDALLTDAKIDRFVAFGTSLGGILTMLLASAEGDRLAGYLLNDIGPHIEEAGLARIRGYVGRGSSWPTWLHAARVKAELHGHAFPDYALEDWLAMAKRLCRLTSSGRIVADYDSKIAEPFRVPNGAAGFDMWTLLPKLGGKPGLLVRGALSDIISTATADRMASALPDMERLTLPRVGHAPTLDEPGCGEAIDRLLARVAA